MIGDEMNAESSAKIDTGLACFAIMANYFEKPLSLEQVKHKYDRQNSDLKNMNCCNWPKNFHLRRNLLKPLRTVWKRQTCRQSPKTKTIGILSLAKLPTAKSWSKIPPPEIIRRYGLKNSFCKDGTAGS